MTIRYCSPIRALGVAALGAFALSTALTAQRAPTNRAPDPGAKIIMVTPFKSAEKGAKAVGVLFAEDLRSRIDATFPSKQVAVVEKFRIDGNLEASGYSITEALAPYDARMLAVNLRADEFTMGTATRTPTGFKVEGGFFLTRDLSLYQPLGVFEAARLTDATTAFVREYREARKQLDAERSCTNAAREKKYPEAIAFAQQGIALFPKGTLARLCLATVLDVSGAPPAEVVKMSNEILAVDNKNNNALLLKAKAFKTLNQPDSMVAAYTMVMANDPKNASVIAIIIPEIITATNPRIARPIIDTVVANNPGDPELLKLRWLILNAVRDYAEMFKQGDELVRLDTSFADTLFFIRTSVAYSNDSQPQKAAEAAARGAAKFPTNAQLVGLEIQALDKAGQTQQAMEKLDKAMASNIPVENGPVQLLIFYQKLGRTAEIVPKVRTMIAAGDSSGLVRQMIFFVAGEEGKVAKASTTVEDFRKPLATLMFADSVIAPKTALKAEAQFRVGGAHVDLANALLRQGQADKSCPMAKEAKEHLVEAQILLPNGGTYNPDVMRQYMNAAMQLDTSADALIKQLCK